MDPFSADQTVKDVKPAGCALGCLGLIFGIPLVLGIIGYIVVFHSSIPIKWIVDQAQGDMSANGNPVEVKGIKGSLSSGVSINEIIIQSEPHPTVIEGFTFRYNGIIDAIRGNRVIIKRISADQSDIVVGADFFEISKAAGDTDKSADSASSSTSNDDDITLFELREMQFEDTRFRTADGKLDIKIPIVRLAGLRIEGNDFELAELVVESDHLNLELTDALPAEADENAVSFQRKVQGDIQPGIHPLVKKTITFSVELGAVDGKAQNRVRAFDGALEQSSLPGGGSLVRFNNLTLDDFIDSDDYVLPERFSITVREVDDFANLSAGEFFIGETRFDITAQKIDTSNPSSAIVGKGEVQGQNLEVWLRRSKKRIWPPFAIELKSDQPQRELLALIYYQKTYDELSVEQKANVDDLKLP